MRPAHWRKWMWALLGLAAIGLVATWASELPDGLEWALERLGLGGEAAPVFQSPLPDYRWGGWPPALEAVLSAVAGGLLVWGVLALIGRFGRRSQPR